MKKYIASFIISILIVTSLTSFIQIKVSDGKMTLYEIIKLKIDCFTLWQDENGKQIYFIN